MFGFWPLFRWHTVYGHRGILRGQLGQVLCDRTIVNYQEWLACALREPVCDSVTFIEEFTFGWHRRETLWWRFTIPKCFFGSIQLSKQDSSSEPSTGLHLSKIHINHIFMAFILSHDFLRWRRERTVNAYPEAHMYDFFLSVSHGTGSIHPPGYKLVHWKLYLRVQLNAYATTQSSFRT